MVQGVAPCECRGWVSSTLSADFPLEGEAKQPPLFKEVSVRTIHWMIKNFPADLHKKAKVRAVQEEISLKDLAIKAVTEYLQKKGKVK